MPTRVWNRPQLLPPTPPPYLLSICSGLAHLCQQRGSLPLVIKIHRFSSPHPPSRSLGLRPGRFYLCVDWIPHAYNIKVPCSGVHHYNGRSLGCPSLPLRSIMTYISIHFLLAYYLRHASRYVRRFDKRCEECLIYAQITSTSPKPDDVNTCKHFFTTTTSSSWPTKQVFVNNRLRKIKHQDTDIPFSIILLSIPPDFPDAIPFYL